MAIDLNSFVWASMGIEPPQPEDAVYNAGDQPIAGFDNFAKWAITKDLNDLNDWAGSHGHVHEDGGSQEIDLDGMSVGGAADLVDSSGVLEIEDGTNTAVSMNVGAGEVSAFPAFTTRSRHRSGLMVGNDVERQDGQVVYDYTNNKFHHAEQADEADWAALAFDSDHLEDHTVQDILDLVESDLIPSAKADVQDDGVRVVDDAERLSFDQSIDVEADGTRARMSVHSVPHAEEADNADNSDHLEGNTTQDILNMVNDGRWSYIGEWELSGGDWPLEIDLDSEDIYDRYRIGIVHEAENEDRHWTSPKLYFRLNGDSRQRYNYMMRSHYKDNDRHRGSDRWRYRDRSNTQFLVAGAQRDGRSYTEYEIACPEPLGTSVDRYPSISEISLAAPYRISGTLAWGQLQTNYNRVDQFTLWPRELPGQTRGYITLWGNDIVH